MSTRQGYGRPSAGTERGALVARSRFRPWFPTKIIPPGRLVSVTVEDAPEKDGEPEIWLTMPEVADRLDLPVNRVHQLVGDRELLAARRDGVLKVPALLVGDGVVVRGLRGVLTLLHDGGYSDDEILRWLFTADETIPGTPAQALAENRGTEIKRRAQAMSF